MSTFLTGTLAMASWVVGLLFLKSWKQSRDRLFASFAVAFFVLSLNWIGLALVHPSDETRHYIYILRLIAFLLIIAAIVDKNRAPASARNP